MPTATFGEFLALLEKNNELSRIGTKVSARLEIAEICDRVCKMPAPHGHQERDKNPAANLGGKALLFEKVEGASMPVAINTFGSYWRGEQGVGGGDMEGVGGRGVEVGGAGNSTTLMGGVK